MSVVVMLLSILEQCRFGFTFVTHLLFTDCCCVGGTMFNPVALGSRWLVYSPNMVSVLEINNRCIYLSSSCKFPSRLVVNYL